MQTSGYDTNQARGIAGQLADLAKMVDAVTLQNSETTGVAYGLGVVDKGDGSFEEPDAATKKIRGVLLHTHAEDNAALDPAGLPTKKFGDVLTRGRVIVLPETAVTIGAEAFCRIAGTGSKGAWRADVDSGNAIHVPRCRFRTAADAGKPAVLELLDGFGEPDLVMVQARLTTLLGDGNAGSPAACTESDIAADKTVDLGAVPPNRHVKVRSATLSCGVTAGDGTDHWLIEVRSGTTVLASHDSNTAAQGAVTQNTPKAMVVANAAGRALERLTLLMDKLASGAAITSGHVMVELEVY